MKGKNKCKCQFWKFIGFWDGLSGGKRKRVSGPKIECIECGKKIFEKWTYFKKDERCRIGANVGECRVCGGNITEKIIFKRVRKNSYRISESELCCEKCKIKHPFPPRG